MLGRQMIAVDLLVPSKINPNKMKDAEFNLLVDNLRKVGLTDPIFVRPVADGKYEVIGGHHRLQAAKLEDFPEVPCTVINDPDFTEDQVKFQIVRHNMIKGSMDPQKFSELLHSLEGKYPEELVAEAFGFADEKEFQKLLKQTKAKLPKELQAAFDEGVQEIKTIDGLSKLLNRLFNDFGDSLPYGYMLMDYGQKESIWLRMTASRYNSMLQIAQLCRKEGRTMDDLVGGMIEMMADGKLSDAVQQLIAKSKPVVIPEKFAKLPTADALNV